MSNAAKTPKLITPHTDHIDIRDVIERVEYLEGGDLDSVDREELRTLNDLLDECKGMGGDHQWRGDWYPVTLIHDSYFTEYARELAYDIGAVNRDAHWPNNRIDWNAAADDLKIDYTPIEFGGTTFWARA